MKLLYLLIIIFIAAPTNKAMEDNKANIITELTTTKESCLAQYLAHDRAVIVSEDTGMEHSQLYKKLLVHIINLEKNEIVKEIIKGNYTWYHHPIHLAVHPNKQKFAISFANMVTIYNSKTGEKEWDKVTRKAINTSTFSPIEDTIFLVHNEYSKKNGETEIVIYNYVTDEKYKIYNDRLLRPTIALHPTQPIMYAGNHKGKLFFYSLYTLSKQGLSFNQLIEAKTIDSGYTERDYQYNHDGSVVIANGLYNIYIVAPNVDERTHPCLFFPGPKFKILREYLMQRGHNPVLMRLNSQHTDMIEEIADPCLKDLIECCNGVLIKKYCPNCGVAIEKECSSHYLIKSYFEKVIFYPQSLILTILLNIKYYDKNAYSIKYWDIQTQKCIHTTPVLETERNFSFDTNFVDLSFSPDATKLLVTFEKKCIELSVPSEILKYSLT